MATIEKRKTDTGETSYRVKIRLKGHPAASATFDRLTDAREWAQRTEADMKSGRYFGAAKHHTLTDLLDKYATYATPRLKSWGNVERRLKYWREKLGSEYMEAIRPARIATLRDELKATPAGNGVTRGLARKAEYTTHERSGADVNRTLAALSSALSYGVKELGWIERNPCEKVSKLPESRGRVRFLDDEELPRFLAACRESSNPNLYLAAVLALTTGGRSAEIMGLRWPQIDFKRRIITLRAGDTKNTDARSLPLSGEAFGLLQERAKVRPIDDDRVFPAAARARKSQFLDLRAPFLAAIKAAGIKDFRWHDLRHSAASYLVMAGTDIVSVARVLGHRQLQMTMRYSHLAPGRVVELGDTLAGKLKAAEASK